MLAWILNLDYAASPYESLTDWTIAARIRMTWINFGTPFVVVLPPPGDPDG